MIKALFGAVFYRSSRNGNGRQSRTTDLGIMSHVVDYLQD